MRVIIVGGGVLGTMHAWLAVRRGHTVVHLEREPAARGASVRNFGLIWVSGRAPGSELDAARRGRELWTTIARTAPGIGLRLAGSIAVVRTEAEWNVATAAAELPDAADRGFELLDAAAVRARNPALRGELVGGLLCERDAIVEPRRAVHAIRAALQMQPGYAWKPGRDVRAVAATAGSSAGVLDDFGERHTGDVVIVCTGAALAGLNRDLVPDLPVRRVRLQMMETAALQDTVSTAVADGDSFRYYPAYRGPALDALHAEQPQSDLAQRAGMQLLLVQRLDGRLTIGDSHAYDEPFDFDLTEDLYDHLAATATAVLGRPLPRIERRWAGVYAETVDRTELVYRKQVDDGVWVVTGPGGRGMTCSPAVAEQTITAAGL